MVRIEECVFVCVCVGTIYTVTNDESYMIFWPLIIIVGRLLYLVLYFVQSMRTKLQRL